MVIKKIQSQYVDASELKIKAHSFVITCELLSTWLGGAVYHSVKCLQYPLRAFERDVCGDHPTFDILHHNMSILSVLGSSSNQPVWRMPEVRYLIFHTYYY